MPATNSVSERSALSLRRSNNWHRTSMTHERLKHCMLLAVYKEKIDNLSSIDVTDEFCFSSEGSRIFGLFCKNDMHFKVFTLWAKISNKPKKVFLFASVWFPVSQNSIHKKIIDIFNNHHCTKIENAWPKKHEAFQVVRYELNVIWFYHFIFVAWLNCTFLCYAIHGLP